MNEGMAERIKNVLVKVCPAFVWTDEGTAVWHGCKCMAEVSAPCMCVWHTTSICLAGQWPQLKFIDNYHETNAKVTEIKLEEAKAAIAAAKEER